MNRLSRAQIPLTNKAQIRPLERVCIKNYWNTSQNSGQFPSKTIKFHHTLFGTRLPLLSVLLKLHFKLALRLDNIITSHAKDNISDGKKVHVGTIGSHPPHIIALSARAGKLLTRPSSCATMWSALDGTIYTMYVGLAKCFMKKILNIHRNYFTISSTLVLIIGSGTGLRDNHKSPR